MLSLGPNKVTLTGGESCKGGWGQMPRDSGSPPASALSSRFPLGDLFTIMKEVYI